MTEPEATLVFGGETYFLTCGHPVADIEGFTTTCLKRREHPGKLHEDYDGRRRHELMGAVDVLEIPAPQHLPSLDFVTREMIRAAWKDFVEPTQIAGEPQSAEMLTIAAVLRAINEGLPLSSSIDEAPEVKELSASAPDIQDAIIVDEAAGPCARCGKNEWTAFNYDSSSINQPMLKCNNCGNTRLDD